MRLKDGDGNWLASQWDIERDKSGHCGIGGDGRDLGFGGRARG